MSDYLFYALIGAGAAAIIAALAVGLVITYQGSGVVNLAHGAITTWTVFTYAELRRGDLPLPVPGLSPRLNLADELPAVVAFPVALAVGAVVAWVTYRLVFRPLRTAPALARMVAAVGVLVVVLGVVDRRMSDVRNLRTPYLLPREPVTLFGDVTVPRDGLWLVAVAAGLAAVVWMLLRTTTAGLRVRAASENEKAAVMLGFSPERYAAGSFVVAAVVTGAVAVLASPMVQLTPTAFTFGYLVPALGAAVVARLRSLPTAVLAGLGIGVVQSMFTQLQVDWSWLPDTGVREGVPLLVIIVAVALGGARVPGRNELTRQRLPAVPAMAPGPWAVLVPAVAVGAALVVGGPLWRGAILTSMIAAVFALSFVVLTGFGGQISLAQLAFAGVAGFGLSKLTTTWNVPFPLAPLLAAALAALLGMLVALPALRIRGTELAVITFAAGVTISELVFKNSDLVGSASTGGAPVANPTLGPWDLGLVAGTSSSRPVFGLLVLVVLVGACLLVIRLRSSAVGRRMLAVRASERAATACGVNVAAQKIALFGVAAFLAGLGGCLTAYRFGNVSDASFGTIASLTALTMAYLGGITTVGGALTSGMLAASGVAFYGLSRLSSSTGRWDVVIGGVLLIVVVVRFPDGLAQAFRRRWEAVSPSVKSRPGWRNWQTRGA
jgi:branched-chain amino acid transport system permease protein